MSRNSVVLDSISNTFIPAATIAGATVFENKYGRERCLSKSMISFLPVVKPPEAPPNAFPNVFQYLVVLAQDHDATTLCIPNLILKPY